MAASHFDVNRIREDFPLLNRTVRNGNKLVYLDSGATAQRPLSVIEAMRDYDLTRNSAAHRGAHLLAEESTEDLENSRATIAHFVGADPHEIIFTKNTTESLNLLAYVFGDNRAGQYQVREGDEVVVTALEHHANLVPWQELCRRTGARLRWYTLTPDGRIDLDSLELTEKTKVLAFTHQSNVTSAITDVEELVRRGRAVGATIVLDTAQSAPHMSIDLHKLDVDFAGFSGHKMCGPTGVGVLYGKNKILQNLPPFLYGGSMIDTVTMEKSTYAPSPQRFEPGVPATCQAVGLAEAIRYLDAIGMDVIEDYEHTLTVAALDILKGIDGLTIVGPETSEHRGATISFNLGSLHPHDIGQILDDDGIAIRVGHHCASPAHQSSGVPSSVRASFYFYNTVDEIIKLEKSLRRAQTFFRM